MTQPTLGSQAVHDHLVWRGGETDLWPLLNDPAITERVTDGLARLHDIGADVVLGPDPGGLLFGPLVAQELRVPFAPVCRDRDFFFQGPHPHSTATTAHGALYVHRAALAAAANVLLVDDWSESGATVLGVRELVAAAGARLTAVAFVVDSMDSRVREVLHDNGTAVRGLAVADELNTPPM